MPKEEVFAEIVKLETRLKQAAMPPQLREKGLEMVKGLMRVAKSGGYTSEYEQAARYIDWLTDLPWTKRSADVLDLNQTRKILDKNHYGLTQIKERVLEYLAVMKLKKEASQSDSQNLSAESADSPNSLRAPILCFVGLVGTGKTTIAYSIAEAMGRKFARIPFGGMGDILYLRGQSRAYPDAEPGQIIKALRKTGTKNPIILLDEIDRVAESARTSIMGVLIELLDPEQNQAFMDHFIDFPFDLSEVLFIATANNTASISTAVMDRLEPIQMPSYTDEEKTTIAKEYILPRTISACGLTASNLAIADSVWPKIVRPLGYDAGVRTLERTIQGICRKVAKAIVEGKGRKFVLTEENIKPYLPTW